MKKIYFKRAQLDWINKIDWAGAEPGFLCTLDKKANQFEQNVLKTEALRRGVVIDIATDDEKTYLYCIKQKREKITFNDEMVEQAKRIFTDRGNEWLTVRDFFMDCRDYPLLNDRFIYEKEASTFLNKMFRADLLLRETYNDGSRGRPKNRYKLIL